DHRAARQLAARAENAFFADLCKREYAGLRANAGRRMNRRKLVDAVGRRFGPAMQVANDSNKRAERIVDADECSAVGEHRGRHDGGGSLALAQEMSVLVVFDEGDIVCPLLAGGPGGGDVEIAVRQLL